MATLKFGEPFGIDATVVKGLDWKLAIARVLHDLRSDFVYAPHLALIYAKAADELIDAVQKELIGGQFLPGLPVTVEVPKSYRMPVAVASRRLGPSYSRPGSILLPKDRLLYQVFADQAAEIIEEKTNKKRSFSHRYAGKDSLHMFVPTRSSWSDLQKALDEYSKPENLKYVVKLDISNFFGSINQHTLINTLNDAGYPKAFSSRLEAMLTFFTTERSSRGILQGMFPSDLFGNYYLAPVDRQISEMNLQSARYVDDMYIFVESVDQADACLRELIPLLRRYDLNINESKSKIIPKSMLVTEEPDLEALFSAAIEEISSQVEDQDFDADYGFQSEWEGDDEENSPEDDEAPDELELKATQALFDSISEYPGQEENIERFCLPLFSKAGSDHAVSHCMDAFRRRSAMTQIYSSYLSDYLDRKKVWDFFAGLLGDSGLTDWQRMWVIAALLKEKDADDETTAAAWSIVKDGNRHDSLRAIAAIYVGRFGDLDRRKSLIAIYGNVSPYVQLAIYYSSKSWPAAERTNVKGMWSNQSELSKLLTIALAK